MHRNQLHRILILLLVLGCSGVGTASAPRTAYAAFDPNSDSPPGGPGDQGAGDPDAPGNGRNMPRPGAGHGGSQGLRSVGAPRTVGFEGWIMRFRAVTALWSRVFFRF